MGKGKIIYRGEIKKLVISSLDIKSNAGILNENSYVINKDAIFYKNRVGKIISFDYGTVLPSYDEAKDWLQSAISSSTDSSNEVDCLYADYDNLRREVIDYNKFRLLGKQKRLRKKR